MKRTIKVYIWYSGICIYEWFQCITVFGILRNSTTGYVGNDVEISKGDIGNVCLPTIGSLTPITAMASMNSISRSGYVSMLEKMHDLLTITTTLFT